MTARPVFTVSGAKATGDVPTVQANGSVAWAAGGGGSQPDLAAVLAEGGDPAGNPVTGPLYIDNADTANPGLTVDAGGANGRIALFRKANGDLVGYIGTDSGLFAPGVDKPTLELSKDQFVVNLDPNLSGFFDVGDYDGNTFLEVLATGGVKIEPAPGSTDSPLDVRLESGGGAFLVASTGEIDLGPVGTRVQAGGQIGIYAHAAPADGDLYSGECALWFDQTNGAAKLMAKGKTADGTVVSAVVASLT